MASSSEDVVDSVCPLPFALAGGLSMPYCSNRTLTTSDPSVRRAVVVVHGTGRNGTGYAQYVQDAATAAFRLNETIVVAPHFLTEADVNAHAPGATVPFWTPNGWKQGDDSLSTAVNPRPSTISSFAVVDAILNRLSDPTFFPNLTNIVIAGHSAGGQFVNRYAAANIEQRPTRYIVANPASYMYLDGRRPVPGTVHQFATPNTACSTYDNYKYGLNSLNPYLQAIGAVQIRTRYQQRRVTYLLGTADNNPNDPDLDQDSCERKLQGSNRFEIGSAYFNYLQLFYGQGILNNQRLVPVHSVGHTASGMFTSPEGIAELFPDAAWLSTRGRIQGAAIDPASGIAATVRTDNANSVRIWMEQARHSALTFQP